MPSRRGSQHEEVWVPGPQGSPSEPPSADEPGAAALERLRELTSRPKPEAPSPERQGQGDDLEAAIDDLAELNEGGRR